MNWNFFSVSNCIHCFFFFFLLEKYLNFQISKCQYHEHFDGRNWAYCIFWRKRTGWIDKSVFPTAFLSASPQPLAARFPRTDFQHRKHFFSASSPIFSLYFPNTFLLCFPCTIYHVDPAGFWENTFS